MAGNGRHLKLVRAPASYAGYRLAGRLSPMLPRRLAYRLADPAGDLFWLFNRAGRLAVRDNLCHVLGHKPPWSLERQVFRHGARNYYDTFIIPTLSSAQLLKLVRVDDWTNLQRALSDGRGAIMVGVHLSSVALAGQVIAAAGYAFTSAVERVEPPELMQLLVRLRSGGGVRVLPLGPDLVKQLLASLRRNEVIGLVMDRDIAGSGVPVRFFGARASVPGGAALLALRTGAPILPAVAIRTSDDRFEGLIGPPIEVERSNDVRQAIVRTTQRIARYFEQHIAAHPEQWTVFQPLWRGTRASPSEGKLP